MATHAPDVDNHVVSLSLLPLNEADSVCLARALGAGPITAESRGYGVCRVTATARRRIWAVQYFNVMDTLILDTLEVGGVPTSLIAAPTDLEDSGGRLSELLDNVGKPS
jgi:hydrogenase-1 operon protein HyaF